MRHKAKCKCNSCKSRKWRKNNPFKAAYLNLKHNAKRRGKLFELTFEQFKQFATKFDYIKKKGRKSTMYHIDRIDENKGYTIDNIQVLTNAENVRKYAAFASDWNMRKQEMEFKTYIIQDRVQYDDVPF